MNAIGLLLLVLALVLMMTTGWATYAVLLGVSTLGAVAGGLDRGGEQGLASELNRKLRRDLEHSTDTRERTQLVGALGNAKLAENRETLTALTKDPEPKVRAAAAGALRADESAEGVSALLALLTDADPSVQQSALSSLWRRELADESIDALLAAVTSVSFSKENDALAVTLLDGIGNGLRRGKYPDRAHGAKIAAVLRKVADDLDS